VTIGDWSHSSPSEKAVIVPPVSRLRAAESARNVDQCGPRSDIVKSQNADGESRFLPPPAHSLIPCLTSHCSVIFLIVCYQLFYYSPSPPLRTYSENAICQSELGSNCVVSIFFLCTCPIHLRNLNANFSWAGDGLWCSIWLAYPPARHDRCWPANLLA
jgi:hypothetical protein